MSPTTKQGAHTMLIQFGSLKPIPVQFSQEAFDIMMIKGQQWMRKRAGQWLLEGDGKRYEHSLFI